MRALIIQHIDIEGPGTLAEVLAGQGWRVEVRDLSQGVSLPETPSGYDSLFVLGGPMNVYEEEAYPFLAEEGKFLREAIQRGIPLLGICLGAQLLAKTLGAAVTRNPVQEIGWSTVLLTQEGSRDPLFVSLEEQEVSVFQWHGDTFALPPGASLLATSPFCQNQAFRWGEVVYGLQFHLEVTEAMVSSWLERYTEDIACARPPVDPARIQQETRERISHCRKRAERLFGAFLPRVVVKGILPGPRKG